ncbi:hypothetical protein C8R44DRAFT_858588 [Mycena epipterygia]|nr:hypothetical protein C8R44DRAFT_858588 [Mycena epipterygia]
MKLKFGKRPSIHRVVCEVSTFNARRLTPRDFIDIMGGTHCVLLRFPKVHVPKPNWFSFRGTVPDITRPHARARGFLYYHTAYPREFLSGGLRFRCTDHPDPLVAFESGKDLLDKYLLPWQLSLPKLLREIRFHSFLEQLVLDGLLTEEKISAAKGLLAWHPQAVAIPAPLIHDIEQPFLIDLSLPIRVRVLGPRNVLNVEIYPAVAYDGTAVVRFERTVNEDELCIRILRLYSMEPYLPEYQYLPPLAPGALLPSPWEPVPWTWNHDQGPYRTVKHSAALHCLFHPTSHFPQT